ncbi:DNA-binding domain-containing protein, AraC-type [Desulfosporosinus orientis DSM 765]|uniref:DNA-binding domain-containing protein, AraC-type n=1 Tax=Desulfosporosinus orientis (strain ATCC 19365 / DSM 765 / NCIMB 8382 / VKM B-1628 / Singapore I) TaxID=768706 RepID=G7W7R2_DESOD|nr:AraC family transcriptional regulator [Desulfosporosinus orientis]AET66127.1 DNA-binding domain-containing protein, AraC-type [Desulfosporosinus orientis DSM 765]
MEEIFKNFLDQIPSEIIAKTETHSYMNMIICRPTSYIIGLEACFEDYHFILPTSDPPPLKIEHRLHHFSKGKLIPIVPETRILCAKPAPTRQYIAMMVKKEFLTDISRECFGKAELTFSRTPNPYSPQLVHFIGRFEEELKEFQDSSPLMLQSISVQIAIQLIRESGNQNTTRPKKQLDRNYIERAIEYITDYYNAKITIEDICQEIHLSPYYFMRMFKDATGQSPHEFLLTVRVGKAEEMLKKGISIQEAAKLCGFVNSAHFSKLFKKVMGIPPSEYKRSYFIIGK